MLALVGYVAEVEVGFGMTRAWASHESSEDGGLSYWS